jgi:MoxR-like ATPase
VTAADAVSQRLELGRAITEHVLDPMKASFVDKDEIIDLLGVCLVAGENLFILGPPGTAKSALVSDLGRRLDGRTFEYLLTRFTEPNELFGPFDIRKLRDGELVTNTEGMLPEASLVFLDELLNANSAILNSLLGVLNERMFRRGKEARRLPLLSAVGASNHLPEDETLGALFDRFLLRVRADSVPDDRLIDVLDAGWRLEIGAADPSTNGHARPQISIEDVRSLHGLLPHVDLAAVRTRLADLVLKIRKAGITVSDRRAVKLQRLAAASALLTGRTTVEASDLWVFRYIWDREEQREVLASLVQHTLPETEAAAVHPRARSSDRPDPESLARDLEQLRVRAEEPDLGEAERAQLRDRLGLLVGRVQWVKEEQQRTFLAAKADDLWNLLPASE